MFKLSLVTPDKKVVTDAEAEEVTLPAFAGELHILPGHSPLMTTLSAGILKYKLKSGESARLAMSWGYCQVSGEGVSVLAENLMSAEEIDIKAVSEKTKNLENRLATESLEDAEYEKVQNEIARLKAEMSLLN